MTTKKILQTVSLFVLIAITSPSIAMVPTDAESVVTTESRTVQLINRLEEIKGMDKSEMTRLEKKTLRKEVKEIKKEMYASTNNGVYLSIGAIIIIVLLLILIL
jgi:glutathionyl-hydroquinone reductase